MNPELAIDIFKGVIIFSLYVVAPFLGVMLVIGFAMSLFQSVTSIQEQTLTFAPKLLALAGLLIALAPWLLRSITEFATTMITRISSLGV
ncbi:MAG TPA: flagellar biosynthetic protein FliQ [Opitutaceae bacterium]|nr:flagellar biosynthetic protein FliQ [Opitutaceae bacterium]